MAETETKPRQQHLPKMAPKKIPAIEQLAEKFVSARDAKGLATNRFNDVHGLLSAKMKEHKIRSYELPDGRTVEVTLEEKVKLRRKKKGKKSKTEANGDGE